MVGAGSRTTICIPTLNRLQFVARTLEYYVRAGFGGVVLIGDGSQGDTADAVRRICSEFKGRLNVELIEAPGIPQPKLFSMLADRVTTDFATYSGDDDYFIPTALSSCEALLDADPTLVAAHGRAIVVNMDGVHGIPFQIEVYPLPTLPQRHPVSRVEAFLPNYGVAIFSLHRSTAWKVMWENCADMEDKAIGAEVAAATFSAALGPTQAFDDLYLVRQIHPQNYRLAAGGKWLLTPSFAQSAQLFTDRLARLMESGCGMQAEEIRARAWNAFMTFICRGFVQCRDNAATDYDRRELREAALEHFLSTDKQNAREFFPVLQSLIGEPTLQGEKPKLLLSWGNPYILDETIGPLLPELAKHFWILLLLVDYKLTPQTREIARSWKERGLIADVLVAPSHGGTIESHLYMAELVPMLRALDFDVFLSISAMQPYERYITDCILPDKCRRILLWPHTTNLFFLYPEIVEAVRRRSRSEIDRAVRKYRALREPKIRGELFKPTRYSLRVTIALTLGLLRQWNNRLRKGYSADSNKAPFILGLDALAAAAVRPSSPRSTTAAAHRLAASSLGATRPVSRAERFARFVIELPGVKQVWRTIKTRWPRLAVSLHLSAVRLNQWRRRMTGHTLAPLPPLQRQLEKWLNRWPILQGISFAALHERYPEICDRYIFPQILVGRWFAFRKYDFLTQIGTDQFDACMFYNETDAEAHKVLFENPNMYVVRYAKRTKVDPAEAINAVLMPFSLHSQSDMTPALLDIYARDLAIALRESGATEVHLRPHPGRPEDWLESLAASIRERGVPCTLTAADKPITDAAARYRGVVGAVSASLRDVRLACPHIFVVGSMGLSQGYMADPKAMIGFGDSIGWIEADGSYQPNIFRPAEERTQHLPDVTEMILTLRRGGWNRVPARLA